MILNFCLHSVFHEYGWEFLHRFAIPHPLRSARALLRARAIDTSVEGVHLAGDFAGGAHSIVGVGYCLKPIKPPCPSGRANHDCLYLDHSGLSASEACLNCAILEVAALTLKTGSAFYIMTSACDILKDVFMPSLREQRFSSGLFVLCRYSFQPFAVGMLAAGIQGYIFQLKGAVCHDYRSWLRADRGIKNEQTGIKNSGRMAINQILMNAETQKWSYARFKKRGNIYSAEN